MGNIKKSKVKFLDLTHRKDGYSTIYRWFQRVSSNDWSSGHFPDKLVVAMRNFQTVYSAWDGDKLIGMVCALDDGIMTAYLHYMLVRPEYHHQGIGHKLLDLMKEHYQDYLRIGLIAYNTELDFYESCGFKKAENASPMFITSLWT